MSNYDYQSGPRGNQYRNDIPEYDPGQAYQQRTRGAHIQNQDRHRRDYYNDETSGSYYVEDYNSQPLSPPRSHYSKQPDPRRGPPSRIPRPEQQRSAPQQPQYQQTYDSQSHHGNGQWTDNGYAAPGAPYRQTPPKDMQTLISQMQKRAPLGPPPSARREPPSYFPQDTPIVHPIVEETDSMRGSTRSRSSTNQKQALAPQVFADDSSSIYSRVPSMPPPAHPAPTPDRADFPPNGINNLVRKASMGMAARPVMTTVKSSDRLKRDGLSPRTPDARTPKRREFPLNEEGEREKTQTPPTRSPSRSPHPGLYQRSHAASSDALGAGSVHHMSDGEGDVSESDLDAKSAKYLTTSQSRSPLVPSNLRSDKTTDGDLNFPTPPSSSYREGKKRPPHLNLAALDEQEQRGSLTSLPDLIQRATRLASNLDRGKTASRLGLSAWLGDGKDVTEKLKAMNAAQNNKRKSNGSLNDMLANFPSPAVGTPTRSTHEPEKHGMKAWTTKLGQSQLLPSDSDLGKERRDRKKCCCGMPLWLIILLIIIAICLIAAAIVIPVVLVVIPEQRNSSATANTTAICESKYGCQNGAPSVLAASGACQCICINGFRGPTCSDQDYTGCYFVNVGSTSNVTIGNSIPRIISESKNNYSIPLDSSTLLGLFSSSSLSCVAENALITFNGLSKRQDSTDTTTADPAATSNGIVFASGDPATTTTSSSVVALATDTASSPAATTTAAVPTTFSTSTTSTSSAPSSATSAASSSGTFNTTSSTLDFARTVVLYMFQTTGQFNSAVAAQQNFQRFFSSSSGGLASAASLGLGSGYTADLTSLKLTLANGTTVGGGPGHT